MGYDMHLVKSVECPDTEAAEVEWNAALAARNALGERPPLPEDWKKQGIDPFDATTWPDSEYKTAQVRVEAASTRMYQADLNYFRLNIWGMSRAREIMDRLGMLATESSRPDDLTWPDWDYDHNEHEPSDCEDEACTVLSAPGGLSCGEYTKQRNAMLTWSPPDEPGILIDKLGSNDGWIVTPMECRSALAKYAEQVEETRKAIEAEYLWWSGWLAFIERAIDNDGFRVY